MKKAVIEKAKRVRLLILDVDGVLTSGVIYYGNNDIEVKAFHVHDGLGIKLLQKSGVNVAVISAKKSTAVSRRLKDLKVNYVHLGYEEKLPVYEDLKKTLQLEDEAIAYMGDDLPDLPVLRRVGLSITVPSALPIMSQSVDYTTKNPGGAGAVREVCDLILNAQDSYETVLQSYLI